MAALDGLVLMGGNDVDPEGYGQEPQARGVSTRGETGGRGRCSARPWSGTSRSSPSAGATRCSTCTSGAPCTSTCPSWSATTATGPRPGASPTSTWSRYPAPTRRRSSASAPGCSARTTRRSTGSGAASSLSAYAVDGHSRRVIEAVEMPGRRFVVGVQWHPEESGDLRPFRALVQAGAVRAEG